MLDAAYCEYVRRNDYEAGLELVATTDNTVMTRTFSKIYGLAALRLGWAYCPAAVADVLNRVRGPFNVNAPAHRRRRRGAWPTARTSRRRSPHNEKWLPWVTAELEKLGLKVTPSVGNFVLIHFPTGEGSRPPADEFLKARGIILRRVGAYGLPNCLRMTIGTEDDNRKVVAALAELPGAVMTAPMFERVALIGLGLIGSSLSHAMRRGGLARTHRRPCADATRRATRRCAWAWSSSVYADGGGGGARRRPRHPVHAGRRLRPRSPRRWRRRLTPGAIVTDVGSVKGAVVRDVGPHVPKGVHFIPGHPIAGTEHSGPESGFAELFDGRWCVLTPPRGRRPGRGRQARRVLAAPAARTSRSWTPQHHDLVLAITSHVPHLIAYNIVNTARHLERVTDTEVIKFSAGGFRDFTRIAASDPVMWRDVFLNNKEAVLEMLGRFSEDLTALQRAIRFGEGETLHKLFVEARATAAASSRPARTPPRPTSAGGTARAGNGCLGAADKTPSGA